MEIIGKSIKLRSFRTNDKTQVAKLCNNKKLFDNVRDFFPHPYSEKDAENYIQFCMKENPQYTFAIEKEGELVGAIGLLRQTDVYRLSAEIGYWIGEPYWGQGIATEAIKLLTKYGFEELGIIRIHTGVFDFNKASQRVLEKAGYKLDCVFKKSIIKNNVICDEYRYSMVKDL
ncbi:MAG: GNAT family N-acetyltransferase [Bacteroidales bacterium]|nr:GNAT family N-acetyltransferase [Bacteroidales bacterium]